MTKEFEQRADLAAAKLLGHDDIGFSNGDVILGIGDGPVGFRTTLRKFTIFGHLRRAAANRDKVQRKLWERGLSICSVIGAGDSVSYFIWDETNQTHFADIYEDFPEMAMAEACIAITEEQEI